MPEQTAPLLVVCQPETNQTELALSLLRSTYGWTGETTEHPALHWFDGTETGLKIEDVRAMASLMVYQPVGTHTFLIILGLENASVPAQQALLKMLEEPPAYVRWLLITTDVHRVLPTVQSRSIVTEQQPEKVGDNEEIVELYATLESASIGELIALSDTYSDRAAAARVIQRLLTLLHTMPATPTLVKQQQILLQTSHYIAGNVNLKLAIGECFIALKAVFTTFHKL